MSHSLVLMMMDEGQIFDAVKMREWLSTRRGAVPVPSIGEQEAIVVR